MQRLKGMRYFGGNIVSAEEYAEKNLMRSSLHLLVLMGFCKPNDFDPSVWKYADGVMKWIIAHQGEPQMAWRLHFNKDKPKYGGGGSAEAVLRIVDFLCREQDAELTRLVHGYERAIHKRHHQSETEIRS